MGYICTFYLSRALFRWLLGQPVALAHPFDAKAQVLYLVYGLVAMSGSWNFRTRNVIKIKSHFELSIVPKPDIATRPPKFTLLALAVNILQA